MKKNLLTLLLSTALSVVALAQVPNGNFEQWTGGNPNLWVSTNTLQFFGNPQSVFQSADAHGGTSACEINTIHVTNKGGANIPDYVGSAFIGSIVNFSPVMGFSYTQRPATMNFWYKYHAVNGDTGTALVMTTKWNTTTNKRDTIALASTIFTDSNTTYKSSSLALYYFSTQAPDTAIILFSSSNFTATKEGSKLLIDDITLDFSAGIEDQKQNLFFELYPNPSTGFTNIQLNNLQENISVIINDMQGKTLWEARNNRSNNISIDTKLFAKGIYIVNVKNEKNSSIQKLIVE